MSAPPIPTPLQELGQRPFSLFPPIVDVEHNEWTFRSATASDVQVMNVKTATDLWIPRHFLSGVSSIEEPVIIVGLTKELRCREGVAVPHIRRVLEMPRAVNESRQSFKSAPPIGRLAPVIGIRLETAGEARSRRFLPGIVAAGILGCVVIMSFLRGGPLLIYGRLAAPAQLNLPLTPGDDYASIVHKLGQPSAERWQSASDGTFCLLLRFRQKPYILVLAGADRDHARFAGALSRSGRVIQSVNLGDGVSSSTLLKQLKPF